MRSVSPVCVLVLLTLAAVFVSCNPAPERLPRATDREGEAAEWELVWADEFETDGRPDPKNWTHESGFVRNEELQWYQPDNATCRNGLLVITARRERVANLHHNPDAPKWAKSRDHADYTSASLTTQGLHQWRYGRFEMRARIDTRVGLWPVFWTLGVEGDWPHGGEIDIMEYYRGTLLANAFWGSKEKWVPVSSINRRPIDRFDDPEWSAKFHVWRMDWDERLIQNSVDETPMCQVDLNTTFNEDGPGKNPLRQPHYLLLSLAIGGDSGGDPTMTEFPATFEVDYVRVYQRKTKP